jgi:uncharacterized damage-inducible protein DinB
MTYYGSKHLADSFRTVRRNTLAIAEEIPEEQYGYRVTPAVRSVGEMLAHVAVSPMWQIEAHQSGMDSIDFAFFGSRLQLAASQEQALGSKAAIVQALKTNGETFAAFLESLDEATLQQTVSFPPPVQPSTKTRFEMLLGPKEHEMHHRGQLMLMQRLLGMVPPLTRAREQMRAAAR